MNDLAAGFARFLTGEWGRPVQVGNVVPVSAGARRRNVLLDADTGDTTHALVATIVPSAVGIVSVSTEAAVRELARTHGVPVPAVLATCDDAAFVGGPFLLSERVDGETVPRKVLRLVQQEEIGDLVGAQLGAAMAALHSIDPALAPESLPGSPDVDPAAQLLAELTAAVGTLLADRRVFTYALRWLERHRPEPLQRPALVHTDIRNGNIIVGPDGLRAVLDWEGAHRFGDPMRDAAWSALRMWRFREDDREIGGFANRDVFVSAYEKAGGTFDEDRFRWWKVLVTLWWGVGLASQAAAHLDGTVRNVVMAASGRRIHEIEWDLLMLLRPTFPEIEE